MIEGRRVLVESLKNVVDKRKIKTAIEFDCNDESLGRINNKYVSSLRRKEEKLIPQLLL